MAETAHVRQYGDQPVRRTPTATPAPTDEDEET